MNRNKKFLLWILSFGKIKAGIIYFFISASFGFITILFWALVNSLLSSHSFIENLRSNIYFFPCILFLSIIGSCVFYDEASSDLKNAIKLEEQGITPTDIRKSDFINKWSEKRQAGIFKYCLYDSGLLTGGIMLIPVSFFLLGPQKGGSERLFPEFSDMMLFIGEIILISYILGCIIGRVRWAYTERKYKRITRVPL